MFRARLSSIQQYNTMLDLLLSFALLFGVALFSPLGVLGMLFVLMSRDEQRDAATRN